MLCVYFIDEQNNQSIFNLFHGQFKCVLYLYFVVCESEVNVVATSR